MSTMLHAVPACPDSTQAAPAAEAGLEVLFVGPAFYAEALVAPLGRFGAELGAASWPFDPQLRGSPDVILLDSHRSDRLRIIRDLVRGMSSSRVVVLRVPDHEAVECLEAGAAAYVGESASLAALVEAIAAAARGELVCSPRIASALAQRVSALASMELPARRPLDRLSPREREVLGLIADGLTDRQIATRLCIEHRTVKNHVHRILKKLGASSRREAARLA
jgi:DNA-binding NarL/FixJ family response regulator